MTIYSLELIGTFYKQNKYVLDESVKSCLDDIEKLIDSKNFIHNYENKKWANFREFKTTAVLDKNITNSEKLKHDIIDLLNKLSPSTFSNIKDKLFEQLKTLSDTDINTVTPVIYNILSNNQFYSKEYALLFGDLIKSYPSMLDLFKTNFNKFIDVFKTIEKNVSSEENYTDYCRINALNQKRRSLSAFFSNLMLLDIMPEINILKIILILQERIVININKIKDSYITDEIIENIYIIMSTIKERVDINNNHIQLIITNIKWLITNQDNYDGISNKGIFKYMDILDGLNTEY
jgi:hypothetical protein